jgi:tRNA1Val (adenine37-N6)-methyltransferase
VLPAVDDAELSSDAITAGFRIWQRRRGHRYSLDDVATAWQAAAERPDAAHAVDLGCGIGSVLLMLAWKLPAARLWGVEAVDVSAALARRSVAENGLAGRAEIVSGDLREVTRDWPHPRCELVTGTPPYLPKGTALVSPDPQRAAARIELRGGVEDYLAAAARVLADDGRVVVCADGRHPERVLAGARAVGLLPLRRRDVFAREDAAGPLLSVWVLGWPIWGSNGGELEHDRLAIRDERGAHTEASLAMRRAFGL